MVAIQCSGTIQVKSDHNRSQSFSVNYIPRMAVSAATAYHEYRNGYSRYHAHRTVGTLCRGTHSVTPHAPRGVGYIIAVSHRIGGARALALALAIATSHRACQIILEPRQSEQWPGSKKVYMVYCTMFLVIYHFILPAPYN